MSTTTTTRGPFVVHVARLRKHPGTRWHEVRQGPIDDLECSGSAVPEGAEVEVDVVLESVGGGIAVTGTVRAVWTGSCRRCLAPAGGEMALPVREHFTRDGDGEQTYPLVDEEIDLEQMARDAVLLELPQAPLCREGCAGLCPGCGADRNGEECGCTPEPDPRWAALDLLRGEAGTGPDLG
ncbi:MAG: YceD family protein [Acidimicrobiales bacterium]